MEPRSGGLDDVLARPGAISLPGTPYRIVRQIGLGSMGEVYEAVHEELGAARAIKVLAARHTLDSEAGTRMRAEARALALLRHPNVVEVLDLGISSGRLFFVMPLLEGRTLRMTMTSGRFDVHAAARSCALVLDGLHAAHGLGLVHRDVKPDNVFLCEDGAVKVLDFGIAKFFGADAATKSGFALGTPRYMAPEQIEARQVDGRTDVYAVGVMLYELLAGRPPFEGDTAVAVACAHLQRRPPPLPERIPGPLASTVMRALQKAPSRRFANANEMASALRAFARDGVQAVTSLGIGPSSRVVPPAQSSRLDATLTASGTRAFTLSGSSPSDSLPREGPEPQIVHDPRMRAASPRARTGPVLRRTVVAFGAVVFAGLVAITLSVSHSGRSAAGISPATAPSATHLSPAATAPDFGSKMSADPRATASYRAGIQAIRDGAGDTAVQRLAEATDADPNFAAAHLRHLLVSSRTWEAWRAEGKITSQLRDDLSEHDRALLEAFLPMTVLPPQGADAERRLGILAAANPADADFAYFLCRVRISLGKYEKGAPLCATAARLDLQLADAHHFLALATALADDVPAAIRAYRACLEVSPLATSCLEELTALQSAEGSCHEAVATAHRWVALEPASSHSHRALAYALFGAGQPREAVRYALDRMWAVASAESRKIDEHQVLCALDTVDGRFTDADVHLREWAHLIDASPEEFEHVIAILWRVPLLIEMGQTAEAARVAAEFMKRRTAWSPTPDADLAIGVRAQQRAMGAISRETFRADRDAWLREREKHDRLATQPRGFDWSLAYTHAVLDREDALEALDALARYLPLPDATTRAPDIDEPIANIYLLAGRPAEALPYAIRASRSCLALDSPLEATRAYLRIGQASEMLGNTAGACRGYGEVVSRWGGGRTGAGSAKGPSVSAREASAAMARLGCPRSP